MIAVLPSTDCLEESQVEAPELYSAKSASKAPVVVEHSELSAEPDADAVSSTVDGPRHWNGELANQLTGRIGMLMLTRVQSQVQPSMV